MFGETLMKRVGWIFFSGGERILRRVKYGVKIAYSFDAGRKDADFSEQC